MSEAGCSTHVCIIDDEVALSELLRVVCESIGLTASIFGSADAYLATCCRDCERCGLLMVDVDLPGTSGLELLARLKSEGFPRPILVISGETEERIAEHAKALGAADFIAKPFQVASVRARIRELVES